MVKRTAFPFVVAVLLVLAGCVPTEVPSGGTPSGVWHSEVVHDAFLIGLYTSLALDSEGRPHISYLDGFNQDLEYAELTDDGWVHETVDFSDSTGFFTSLELDENGYPHISYWNTLTGELMYARRDESGWHVETVSDTEGIGMYTSLELDESGRPHILYVDNTDIAAPKVMYTWWDGSTWQAEAVSGEGEAVWGLPSFVLDGYDRPHAVYFYYSVEYPNGTLVHVWKDGGTWQKEHVVNVESGDVVEYSALAVDNVGNPHVVYYDYEDGLLRYAKRVGGSWEFENVEGSENAAEAAYISLVLDDAGYPHLTYEVHDGGYDYLKYSWKDGSGWHVETVDKDEYPDLGFYSSLALDDSGRPHVSYHYSTGLNTGVLKYAVKE